MPVASPPGNLPCIIARRQLPATEKLSWKDLIGMIASKGVRWARVAVLFVALVSCFHNATWKCGLLIGMPRRDALEPRQDSACMLDHVEIRRMDQNSFAFAPSGRFIRRLETMDAAHSRWSLIRSLPRY
jgi:hypothetical protein